MSQVIIYSDDDGKCVIVIPTPEILQKNTINDVAFVDVPEGKSYQIIEADQVPASRTFRQAWRVNGKAITQDMPECKNIAMAKVRAKRDEKFTDFDKRYNVAQRDNADLAALKAERQTLKDIPQVAQLQVDAATTPEQLEEIINNV